MNHARHTHMKPRFSRRKSRKSSDARYMYASIFGIGNAIILFIENSRIFSRSSKRGVVVPTTRWMHLTNNCERALPSVMVRTQLLIHKTNTNTHTHMVGNKYLELHYYAHQRSLIFSAGSNKSDWRHTMLTNALQSIIFLQIHILINIHFSVYSFIYVRWPGTI